VVIAVRMVLNGRRTTASAAGFDVGTDWHFHEIFLKIYEANKSSYRKVFNSLDLEMSIKLIVSNRLQEFS
jgi:hypothetical protein